jgi:hypothetical protein
MNTLPKKNDIRYIIHIDVGLHFASPKRSIIDVNADECYNLKS